MLMRIMRIGTAPCPDGDRMRHGRVSGRPDARTAPRIRIIRNRPRFVVSHAALILPLLSESKTVKMQAGYSPHTDP